MYGIVTLYDVAFQLSSISFLSITLQSYNPNNAVTMLVWALPRSLATTWGIIKLFSLPPLT
jgi:hypothetical protein